MADHSDGAAAGPQPTEVFLAAVAASGLCVLAAFAVADPVRP